MFNRLLTMITVMSIFCTSAKASESYYYEEPSNASESHVSMLRGRDTCFLGMMAVPIRNENKFAERFPGVRQCSQYIESDSTFAFLKSAASGYKQNAHWNLPYDLTIFIARQLDNETAKAFALVCMYFSNAANHRPNLKFQPLVTDHSMLVIMRTKNAITSLSLALDDFNHISVLKYAALLFPELKTLDLTKCTNMDAQTILGEVALPQTLTSLGLPRFKACRVHELMEFAKRNPSLTTLNLAKSPGVYGDGLTEVARLCPRLKSLGIHYGSTHYSSTWTNPSALILETDLIPDLTALDLRGSKGITSHQIAEIIQSRPALKSLKLSAAGRSLLRP